MSNCFIYIQIYVLGEERVYKIRVVNLPFWDSQFENLDYRKIGTYRNSKTRLYSRGTENTFCNSVDDTVKAVSKLVREGYRERVGFENVLEPGRQKSF